jgi:hypothetical protein
LIGEYNLENHNTIRYKLLLEGLDPSLFLLYTFVMFLNKTYMTVTTNERGQQNMWAIEPPVYISDEDAIKYGMKTYAERAELANGRWAMVGFVAGIISYASTGNFFFGVF